MTHSNHPEIHIKVLLISFIYYIWKLNSNRLRFVAIQFSEFSPTQFLSIDD